MPREQPIIRVIPRLLDLHCWNSSGDHVAVMMGGGGSFDLSIRDYIMGCIALVAYEEWNLYIKVIEIIPFLTC